MQFLSSAYVALLVSLFLLAFPTNGYSAMAEFKYNLFIILCGGYSVLMILNLAELALMGKKPIKKMIMQLKKIPTFIILLCLLVFFTVLSAVFSEYSGTFTGAFRQDGVLTTVIYVISCFFLAIYLRPQKWMIFLLGISASLFCLLAIVQLTGANPFNLYPAGYNYYDAGIRYSGEYLGTIGNVGLGAAFLSITMGLFSMGLIKFDFKEKWLLAIPLFLAVFLLFEMKVDAGIVALAAGLVIMFPVAVTDRISLARTLLASAIILSAFIFSKIIVFSNGYVALEFAHTAYLVVAGVAVFLAFIIVRNNFVSRIPERWFRIAAIAMVFSALCFSALFLWFYKSDGGGMIYEASEVLHGRWEDSYGSGRIYIWRNVLGGVKENLLLGTGPDTLGYWDIESFTRYSQNLDIMLASYIDAAHNEYIQLLACSGLLSLLCYLGLLAHLAGKWLRYPNNKISAVVGAGILFYCIQAFFSISMFLTAPFLWTSLAVLIHAQNSA